jgi:hypothetical protein
MSPANKIYILCAVFFLASCTGMREIERKDIFGRVSAIAVYNGSKIEKISEIAYSDNSFNPASIIYKKDIKGLLIPYKEEEYIYQYNNLKSIVFYIYNNNKRIKTGWIDYNYNNNNLKNIGYYILDEKIGILFMFAFDSYEYDDNYKLTSRRYIEYDYQPEKKEITQTAQYVFFYNNGNAVEMRTWILEKKSNKIIEKKEKNLELVNNTVRNIEETCNIKVRGKDFIK